MLLEFQNEIIAIIVAICLVVVFLVLKKDKQIQVDTDSDEEKETHAKEAILKPTSTPQAPPSQRIKTEVKTTPEVNLGGSEEGDFGPPVETTIEEPAEQRRKSDKTITKRDVPKHDKITKQNFTEFSGQRILIAEDNLINQKVLTGLLAGSGIELVMADDGQEALDILKQDTNFLLILMDAHMPRVDGFEATRIIRSIPEYDHILVVALSGDTASDDIAKMKDAGMAEQLEKPLRMDSLYDVIYAYSGKTVVKDDPDFLQVVMTKELNGEKGLETCGGDEEFYRDILNEFIQTYENSTNTLGDLLRSEKLKEADKLLLDIIGITANIGAIPLNTVASDIKSALNDTEEKSYLSLIKQYKTHIDNLLQDIKEYL